MTPKQSMKPRGAADIEPARQRMMLLGPEQIADVELLAIILRGHRGLDRALALLNDAGGLLGIDRAEPQQLARTRGVGIAGATAISAALELGRRVARLPLPHAREIRGTEDVAELLRSAIRPGPQEMLLVLGLDVHSRLKITRTVAMGSLASVQVHPREVFRPLVQAGTHSAVLVHHHPSGIDTPSDSDVLLIHRMVEIGRWIGIPVVDHIVVTRTSTVSMAERGLLETPRHGWCHERHT